MSPMAIEQACGERSRGRARNSYRPRRHRKAYNFFACVTAPEFLCFLKLFVRSIGSQSSFIISPRLSSQIHRSLGASCRKLRTSASGKS